MHFRRMFPRPKGDMNYMNRLTSAALVFALIVPGVLVAATPIDTGVFKLELPDGFANFTEQSQTSKQEQGVIETTNWVSKSPTGEAVVVTLSRMPGPITQPETLIASTRDSLLKSLKATLETEEKREDVWPSERLMFRSENAFFRSRFVVAGDRFYQLLHVSRSAEQRSAPGVETMFNSFTINVPAPVESAAAQ